MTESAGGQLSFFDLDTSLSKTSLDSLVQKAGETSKPRLRQSSKSSSQTRPTFLYLRDGASREGCLEWAETDSRFPSAGEYTTRSFGECPSEENASLLSQILEERAPEKYYLSAKACQGILNRAMKRGKALPPELEKALRAQSVSKNAQGDQGGGKGILIQTEKTGALSTLNNQAIAFKQGNGAKAGGIGAAVETSPTLSAVESGTNQVPAIAYGISSYNSNAMLSDNPNSGIYEAQTSRTLDGGGGGSPACNQGGIAIVEQAYSVDCRNGTENANVNGTLQAKSNGGISYNCNNVVRIEK